MGDSSAMVWAQNLNPREAAQEFLIKRYVGNLTSEEQLPTMKIGVAVASWRKGLWPPQI